MQITAKSVLKTERRGDQHSTRNYNTPARHADVKFYGHDADGVVCRILKTKS